MKTLLIWGLSSIIVLGGIAAVSWNIVRPDLADELSKPWIEVVQPAVFEISENPEGTRRELLTGDEIFEGTVISVEKSGLANIHFPDGSVARLDSGTKIQIESGSFNPKTGTLSVTLNLLWGRVWSKIIGLATPESHWEVKTSTAVATVRGTAFGVEYVEEGKSNIVGYENKVEVAMFDPETYKVLEGVKMLVEPGKLLEVRKEAVAEMKKHLVKNEIKEAGSAVMSSAGALLMEVKQAPKAMMDKDWVKRGIEEDRKLQEKIDRIKENIKDEVEVRKEMRKELRENFQEKINERRENLKNKQAEVKEKISEARETINQKVEERKEQVEAVKTEIRETISAEAQKKIEFSTGTTEEAREIAAVKPVLPVSLSLQTKNPLTEVREDEVVILQAILTLSDGTRKDVTDSTRWQVIGLIGSMGKPGVFFAKMDPTVSELGAAPGAIGATWVDEKSGIKLEAQTQIFKVQTPLDTNTDLIRG